MTRTFTFEEFPLCNQLVQVKVLIEATSHGRESSQFEGHGRVCTFAGAVTNICPILLSVDDGEVERSPYVEELEQFDRAFWNWISVGNREEVLKDELFETV